MTSLPSLSNCPSTLKSISPYLHIAQDHITRDVVISYWCLIYAVQSGMALDSKSPNSVSFLSSIMNWLEKTKSDKSDNEALNNEIVAQAHIENHALMLFTWADTQERSSLINKNVVKAFYTSGLLFDIMTVFGKLNEDIEEKKKYAKWKAASLNEIIKNNLTGNKFIKDDKPKFGFVVPKLDQEKDVEDNNEATVNNSGFMNNTSFTNTTALSNTKHDMPLQLNNKYNPDMNPKPDTGETITTASSKSLSYETINQAQKCCKFANSALNYEDIPTAIKYLHEALLLLQANVPLDKRT